jgi:hypothetical protein
MDFGLAVTDELTRITQTGGVVGTAAYDLPPAERNAFLEAADETMKLKCAKFARSAPRSPTPGMPDFGGAGTDCGSHRLERRRHSYRECQKGTRVFIGLFRFHRRSLTSSIRFTTSARDTSAAMVGSPFDCGTGAGQRDGTSSEPS